MSTPLPKVKITVEGGVVQNVETSIPMKVKIVDLDNPEEPDIERYIKAAFSHGVHSDPHHEIGDLQDMLRLAWSLLTPEQIAAFVEAPGSEAVLEAGDEG